MSSSKKSGERWVLTYSTLYWEDVRAGGRGAAPNIPNAVEVMPVSEHEVLRKAAENVVRLIDAEAAECMAEYDHSLCPTCIEQKQWADELRAALEEHR
jgi:hypothetical protein